MGDTDRAVRSVATGGRGMSGEGWFLDAPVYSQIDADADGSFETEHRYLQSAVNGDILGFIPAAGRAARLDYSMFGLPRLAPAPNGFCGADVDDGTGTGTPDGGVDFDDLSSFLAAYEPGDLAADLDDGSGLGIPDDGVDANDLLYFLTAFEEGTRGGDINNLRFAWRGYRWDKHLQLYHVRHRAFDPKLMVWLQPDPLGEIDGPNPYAYVGWDPFNRIDPLGLAWWNPYTWGEEDWNNMMDRNRGLQQGKRDDLARRGKLDPCTGQMLANSFAAQDAQRATVNAINDEINAMALKGGAAVVVTAATMGAAAPATLTGAMAYGAGIGLVSDLAGQGAAMGLGYQHDFRAGEVVISTGFGAAGGGLGYGLGKGLEAGLNALAARGSLIPGYLTTPVGTLFRNAGKPQPSGEFYSVVFEMRLTTGDLGKSRPVHFNRANAALDSALRSDAHFSAAMEGMIPGVRGAVSKAGGRETPAGWVWHQAVERGVMQLVPEAQHTAGSVFWLTLHPDGRGGYAIWAIFAGAPAH